MTGTGEITLFQMALLVYLPYKVMPQLPVVLEEPSYLSTTYASFSISRIDLEDGGDSSYGHPSTNKKLEVRYSYAVNERFKR